MVTALIPLLTKGTTSFSQLIEDSQARFASPSPAEFYVWMDRADGRSLIKGADARRERTHIPTENALWPPLSSSGPMALFPTAPESRREVVT